MRRRDAAGDQKRSTAQADDADSLDELRRLHRLRAELVHRLNVLQDPLLSTAKNEWRNELFTTTVPPDDLNYQLNPEVRSLIALYHVAAFDQCTQAWNTAFQVVVACAVAALVLW